MSASRWPGPLLALLLPLGAAAQQDYSVPAPTAEEEAAAFPDLGGMDMSDHMGTPLLAFFMADQLEWREADREGLGAWDASGWIGYDFNRLWFRTEGASARGETAGAEAHLLYGRAVARWWEVVAGVRHDFEPGAPRTFAALGIQGLAPYWFETQLTFYAGESGQASARLELEYELLLTNRLVLQPTVELQAYGRRDVERGTGAGLSTVEAGARLRYEIVREFAPYAGVEWERTLGRSADLARTAGEHVSETALVAGVRVWF